MFSGFYCNCLSYFTTVKISFTSILYLQFTHMIFIIYTSHCNVCKHQTSLLRSTPYKKHETDGGEIVDCFGKSCVFVTNLPTRNQVLLHPLHCHFLITSPSRSDIHPHPSPLPYYWPIPFHSQGIANPDMREEIYCQLCNQTWGNTVDSNNERGWLLMALCLGCFVPSARLHHHLLKYGNSPHLTLYFFC